MPHTPPSSHGRLRTQFDIGVKKTSRTIDVNCKIAKRLIRQLNSQFTTRRLEFRDDSEQLDLLRLELLRLKIAYAMARRPQRSRGPLPNGVSGQVPNGIPRNEEPTHGASSTVRTHSATLSESEISVLDIGPSLPSTHNITTSTTATTTTTTTTLRRTSDSQSGVVPAESPNLTTGPDSDGLYREHPSQLNLQTDDVDSVAITSTSGFIEAGVPLHERTRRHAQLNLPRPGPRRFQLPPDDGETSPGDPGFFGYGYGFSGFAPVQFTDEPDRHIHPLSVPHSPHSPSDLNRPPLPRSQSSFGGMEPEFAAMQNAERLRTGRAAKASETSSSGDAAQNGADEEDL